MQNDDLLIGKDRTKSGNEKSVPSISAGIVREYLTALNVFRLSGLHILKELQI